MKYIIVLFKNKNKKKIINKFVTLRKAKEYYDKILNQSLSVVFPVEIENGKNTKFDISLIDTNSVKTEKIYTKDELGRNVEVKLLDSNYNILTLSPYKMEEKIQDFQTKQKIDLKLFFKKYISGDSVKIISRLNNKVVVQNDEKFYLFTTKSENESHRFLKCLERFLLDISFRNCIIVTDDSIVYKKEMYSKLEKCGFKKDFLYRKFTRN